MKILKKVALIIALLVGMPQTIRAQEGAWWQNWKVLSLLGSAALAAAVGGYYYFYGRRKPPAPGAPANTPALAAPVKPSAPPKEESSWLKQHEENMRKELEEHFYAVRSSNSGCGKSVHDAIYVRDSIDVKEKFDAAIYKKKSDDKKGPEFCLIISNNAGISDWKKYTYKMPVKNKKLPDQEFEYRIFLKLRAGAEGPRVSLIEESGALTFATISNSKDKTQELVRQEFKERSDDRQDILICYIKEKFLEEGEESRLEKEVNKVGLWEWNKALPENPEYVYDRRYEPIATKHRANAEGAEGIQPHEIEFTLLKFLGKDNSKKIEHIIITTGVANQLKVSSQTITYLGRDRFTDKFHFPNIKAVWIVPTAQGIELYNSLVYLGHSVAALLHKTC